MPARASAASGGTTPRLVTAALLALFAASLGGMSSFHLLLSVVPLYAAQGGAGAEGAGLATGALLLATVGAELVAPRLVAWCGHRLVYATGLVLLGTPALMLPLSDGLVPIVAISAVRGLGFGLVVVLGSTLVAELVPPERRGEGLGLHGIVIGAPGVLALPFGVFLVGQIDFLPVFVAAGVASLAGLAAVGGLPGRARSGHGRPQLLGIVAGLRMPSLVRPAWVFAVSAMSAGIVVTFLPIALPEASTGLVALALLVQAATAVAARWWAGWYGDRSGSIGLVIPSLVAATAGVFLLVLTDSTVAVLAAMVLFGVGFGVLQNASLALMFQRVPPTGYAMVGALWNIAFDAAMGLGALGFGLLVVYTGYPAAFAVTGAVMLLALVPAWRDRLASAR